MSDGENNSGVVERVGAATLEVWHVEAWDGAGPAPADEADAAAHWAWMASARGVTPAGGQAPYRSTALQRGRHAASRLAAIVARRQAERADKGKQENDAAGGHAGARLPAIDCRLSALTGCWAHPAGVRP